MITRLAISPPPGAPRRRRAFTLTEIMVSMAVFSLAMVGMVYTHLYGLKQDKLVQSKLGASDQSRRAFNQMGNDIRAAKRWDIGNATDSAFVPTIEGQLQQGNAIRLGRTDNTNQWVIYYFSPAALELRRRETGASGFTRVATHLTNSMFFRAETPQGQTQTDLSHKGVIHCQLEFAQYQYPLTRVGAGFFYDYYRLNLRITSRVPDGP